MGAYWGRMASLELPEDEDLEAELAEAHEYFETAFERINEVSIAPRNALKDWRRPRRPAPVPEPMVGVVGRTPWWRRLLDWMRGASTWVI